MTIQYDMFDAQGNIVESHSSTIVIDHYRNGNLAIAVSPIGEEFEDDLIVITTNLGLVPTDPNCAFIDDNNNPCVLKWILENNLGSLTGRCEPSGMWMYDEVRFDLNEISKYTN